MIKPIKNEKKNDENHKFAQERFIFCSHFKNAFIKVTCHQNFNNYFMNCLGQKKL